jgi:hypothetical protein
MNAVMETERALGRTPRIMATRDSCYDIESVSRDNKGIRFIMVRAFSAKDKTIVLTRTQMTAGLNLGENHVIAMVEVDGEAARVPRYVHPPLHDTLPFNEVGVEFRISDLLRESFQPN